MLKITLDQYLRYFDISRRSPIQLYILFPVVSRLNTLILTLTLTLDAFTSTRVSQPLLLLLTINHLLTYRLWAQHASTALEVVLTVTLDCSLEREHGAPQDPRTGKSRDSDQESKGSKGIW